MHRLLALLVGCCAARMAHAEPLRGLVFDDRNGDRAASPGELGVANAVVALGVTQFAVTDAHGEFTLDVPTTGDRIAWVRVPDGFVPGPVFARITEGVPNNAHGAMIELGLRRAAPRTGPVSFVVAADTHITPALPFVDDLGAAAAAATAIEPPPAFFTILGDTTQGGEPAELAIVDRALAGLAAPYIPVPGNHDWYDNGAAWFAHYGPDNYSFDIGNSHFVVWNMAMSERDIRRYLGAELAHVAPGMTIVALTHAPPSEPVARALRALGVDYVLTGHTHSNRVVDRDGVIELNTQPMLMGGLDFTPAGYRVLTLDERGALASYHRTVVDEPVVEVIWPARGACVPLAGGRVLAAVEVDASEPVVTARIDCAAPLAMQRAGGWSWQVDLPPLPAGAHTLTVEASGAGAVAIRFDICDPAALPPAGTPWPQLGGGPAHLGARSRELAPPLVTRWATPIGGHALQSAPVIAHGRVYAAATDLDRGGTGGMIAIDLATGAVVWRTPTALPVRGGPTVSGDIITAAQVDGTVLGLDAATGEVRWTSALGSDLPPAFAAIFAPPTDDGGDVLIGNVRRMAALSAREGAVQWETVPVMSDDIFHAQAALGVGEDLVLGVFNRAAGGLIAWDRMTGEERWRLESERTIGINAAPVIAGDTAFIVNGLDEVSALELATGAPRWTTKLDPAGFEWGNATVGTPALANGVLVVPTLYRDLVALDAVTGAERWRHAGRPSALRATHYRGAGEAGFASSPVITGDIVWAADTSGRLVALALGTGELLWQTELGVPVLAGLAVSGDWLVVASYDGSVRALHTARRVRATSTAARCASSEAAASAGCCRAASHAADPRAAAMLAIIVGALVLRRRRLKR